MYDNLIEKIPVIFVLCQQNMERGGMPLHDAVGINYKKGATTENQDSSVKYMG